jgi:predicted amino acid racemase
MATPRLEINLEKIYHNAHELVTQLANLGISVTGVTKSTLGSVEIANTLLQAGVSALGDSRIQNIKAMRLRGKGSLVQDASMTLIRSPMISEIKQVVMYADVSCNTEIEVIKNLSNEAKRQGRTHQIILMVELGDLREGIMPDDLIDVVREVLDLPNILVKGIGTNLACRSGVSPGAANMAELTKLADRIEATFDLKIETVSGGNSANLQWASDVIGTDIGRVNNLRLGEAILLGRETLNRLPIDGLHTDAITLTAEVIESKLKPSQPTGEIAQTAFGEPPAPVLNHGTVRQGILAVGIQDVDPSGLHAPGHTDILGASSDHLIVESTRNELFVGQEIEFQINYSALLRAMTSPFVSKVYADRKAASFGSPQTGELQR